MSSNIEKYQGSEELLEKLVKVNRVAKVVKGGRQFGFTALTVIGDGNGKIGVGYGKAKEVPLAIQKAMEKACDNSSGTMAAILGLEDKLISETCQEFDGNVIAANFNCPGQVVISGEINAVKNICEVFNSLGARRSLILPVGGAFHSSLMNEAKNELTEAINNTSFNTPICPIYQNVDAAKTDDVQTIKKNLINQLTAPVLWTQIINNMIDDGLTEFVEIGPGKVLQGLIKKINREVSTQGALG